MNIGLSRNFMVKYSIDSSITSAVRRQAKKVIGSVLFGKAVERLPHASRPPKLITVAMPLALR
ncbi:hypothetical protein D3C78_1941530 [compost metagenome]